MEEAMLITRGLIRNKEKMRAFLDVETGHNMDVIKRHRTLCPDTFKEARERLVALIPVINASAYNKTDVVSELEKVFPEFEPTEADHATIVKDMKRFVKFVDHVVNYPYEDSNPHFKYKFLPYLANLYKLEVVDRIKKMTICGLYPDTYYRLTPLSPELRTWQQVRARIFADFYMVEIEIVELISVCPECAHAFAIRRPDQWCCSSACTAMFQEDFPKGLPKYKDYPIIRTQIPKGRCIICT